VYTKSEFLNNLIDFLHAAPGLFALFGFILGALATMIVVWRFFPLQTKALDALVKTQNEQVNLLTLSRGEALAEKDEYKHRFQSTREELTVSNLKIKELEARPDLSSITLLLGQQNDWMKMITKTMTDHAESDAKIFGELSNSISQLPDQLQRLSDGFDERQRVALEQLRGAGK